MSKKNSSHPDFTGKMGGLAVKDMIRDVEQAMASGAQISAAPDSRDEAELLEQVRAENRRSAINAQSDSSAQG